MGGKKLDARNWNVRFDFFANASFWGERGSFNCCERRNEDEDSMEMLERPLSVSCFFLLSIFTRIRKILIVNISDEISARSILYETGREKKGILYIRLMRFL